MSQQPTTSQKAHMLATLLLMPLARWYFLLMLMPGATLYRYELSTFTSHSRVKIRMFNAGHAVSLRRCLFIISIMPLLLLIPATPPITMLLPAYYCCHYSLKSAMAIATTISTWWQERVHRRDEQKCSLNNATSRMRAHDRADMLISLWYAIALYHTIAPTSRHHARRHVVIHGITPPRTTAACVISVIVTLITLATLTCW